jgi:HSP20 family protein
VLAEMSIYGEVHNPFNNFVVWDPYHRDNHSGAPFAAPRPAFSYEATVPLVSTKIHWKETPEAHMFRVDLPGLTKDEVKVELEQGNVICVIGEKIIEKEEKADHSYHLERSGGKFVRSFRLPENSKAKNMKACMENGVLTITVPKKDMNKTSRLIHVG